LTWSEALLALLVSHVTGDVLFQTDWQARHKGHGLPDTQGRHALASHLATYMLAFVPALVWIGLETSAIRAVAVGVLVAATHVAVDEGRLVRVWLRKVKLATNPSAALSIAVDQSFHILCLFGAALLAAA
jgi:hypothetical protein